MSWRRLLGLDDRHAHADADAEHEIGRKQINEARSSARAADRGLEMLERRIEIARRELQGPEDAAT